MFSFSLFPYSHKVFPQEVKMMFVAKLLRTLGVEFNTFFLPIFLYQIGAKLMLFPKTEFQNGLILIGLFYLIERIGVGLSSIWVGKLTSKLGFQKAIAISQVLFVVMLTLFALVKTYPWLLLIILLIEFVRLPLFWCSYYALFSGVAQYKHMGESV